jgi:hypothetical protein
MKSSGRDAGTHIAALVRGETADKPAFCVMILAMSPGAAAILKAGTGIRTFFASECAAEDISTALN